jgi:hypothetical protein
MRPHLGAEFWIAPAQAVRRRRARLASTPAPTAPAPIAASPATSPPVKGSDEDE